MKTSYTAIAKTPVGKSFTPPPPCSKIVNKNKFSEGKNQSRLLIFCTILATLFNFIAMAQEWEHKKPNTLFAVPHQFEKYKDTTKINMKVGIGTASPLFPLHVVGDAYFKGNVNVNGMFYADSMKAKTFIVDSVIIKGPLHVTDSASNGSFDFYGNCRGTRSNIVPAHDDIKVSTGILTVTTGTGGYMSLPDAIMGISTETPQSALHIHQTGSSTPPDVYTLFTNGTNSNNTNGLEIGIAANQDAIINQRQNLPMLFKTNNLERMRILNDGKIGIGTATPNSKLEINSGTAGTSGLQFTTLTNASAALANPLKKVLSVDNTGKVILVNDAEGTTGTGTGDVTGCAGTTADNNYLTKWTNATNKTICKSIVYADNFGVGIGTKFNTDPGNNPKARLDISGEGQQWMDIGSTTSNSKLRLMANSSDNQSQLRYNGSFFIAPLTSGAVAIMCDENSNVGIGAIPSASKLYVRQSNGANWAATFINGYGTGKGVLIQAAAGLEVPAFQIEDNFNNPKFVVNSSGKLDVNGTSNFNGDLTINGNGKINNQTITSDQLFKTNVDSLHNALATIKQLKPKSYYFDTANVYGLIFSNSKQYGFIAQDLESILPELVSSTTKPADVDTSGNIIHPAVTYKGVNYNAFFGILTKGIQEQSVEIESLKTKINKQDSINTSLQNQLNQLLNCCNNNENRSTQSHSNNSEQHYKTMGVDDIIKHTDVELNDAQSIVLEQNVPNPFAEQTTITYFLPEATAKAQMLFYNAQGKLIQSTELTQKGKGQLNVFASDLSSGIYTYTLVVDGKIIETKQMIKAK